MGLLRVPKNKERGNMNILVLGWTDDKGNKQTKEYTDEKQARKAKACQAMF